MNIDLNKLVNKFDEVKIEVGPFGGRTLVFEDTRFKMNTLVKLLVTENHPLCFSTFKKIEKINHTLPDNLNFIQKILTRVRQFFGNISYNRDKDLFTHSIRCHEFAADKKNKFNGDQINISALGPVDVSKFENQDKPKDTIPEKVTLKETTPNKETPTPQTTEKKKEESKETKKEKKKVEIKPPPAPSPASLEPPATDAKPKLQRSKSFKGSQIIAILKETCEIDDLSLSGFAKDFESNIGVLDKDYLVKLNIEIQKVCGEPLFKYVNGKKEERAFQNPDSRKIIQYVISRFLTTDKMNFATKSRLIENLCPYIPIESLKFIFENYIKHIVDTKNYYPHLNDETFRFLMERHEVLCKENSTNIDAFKKEDIASGIASAILKNPIDVGWLKFLIDRYKKDKEVLIATQAILTKFLKANERRTTALQIEEYLDALKA